jgi:predicted nuclease of predicted toxin-antitoxin system
VRVLADAGVSPDTVLFLTQQGHDAVHVRTLGMQRAADHAIVEHARNNQRVVLTFDLDFGDILALGVVKKPSVILLRLSDERPDAVNQRLSTVIGEQHEALESGALIVVEDARYRLRKLPIRPG